MSNVGFSWVAAKLNCSRVPLLPRLCHVHGRKRRPTSRSPGQTLTAVSNLIYDHRISTCFLYGCVGTCWWEFGDPGHENAMFPRGFFDIFDFRSMFCQDYLHSWSQRRDRRIASHFWIVVSEWLCCRNSAACMAGKRYCILRSLGQSPTTVSKSSMI